MVYEILHALAKGKEAVEKVLNKKIDITKLKELPPSDQAIVIATIIGGLLGGSLGVIGAGYLVRKLGLSEHIDKFVEWCASQLAAFSEKITGKAAGLVKRIPTA